jgi:hypothetical protein
MMKRLLFFAALIVAIGSIGGNMLTAHAQTAPTATTVSSLTPAQITAMQQELQVAQATLINLEMQNGIVPSADGGTPSAIPTSIAGTGSQSATVAVAPTTGLSANQISAFKTTLSALAATLSQLNASVVSNSTLTPPQEVAVQATLNGMQGTLVAMANDVANGGNSSVANSAPLAATQPASAPVAVNNTPSSATAPATPAGSAPIATQTPITTPTVTAQASPSADNVVPQTAQASSIWSFTKAHWPTIVIVLLVIAILAILFWPEKKEAVRTVSTEATGSGKPKSAPIPTATSTTTVNFSRETTFTSAKPVTSSNAPAPATPVASAVAAPMQK